MSTSVSETARTSAKIPLGRFVVSADIVVPGNATGIVVFAHGSGSGRYSPRNRHVADVLNQGGIATVLADLLTEEEEAVDSETAALRFDIMLLGHRLIGITNWIEAQPELSGFALGYFGASTGAAAALVAAAERPDKVRAVVSRGGRPDLAADFLARVSAPTLFIVGSRDPIVLDLNYSAITHLPMTTEFKVEIVRGASHLFQEPGTLDQVAVLARQWFLRHLRPKGH